MYEKELTAIEKVEKTLCEIKDEAKKLRQRCEILERALIELYDFNARKLPRHKDRAGTGSTETGEGGHQRSSEKD